MNKKISSLDALGATPAVGDIIPITDVSDTTGSSNGTTKKVTVANLVAAAPQGDLLASNNLSDVANAGTSRTNLGLGTAALLDVGTTASNEPDIELTDSDGEVYSVVTGDSDSIGGNGLPIRQGYQVPSMGANPSPLLISGGTIS